MDRQQVFKKLGLSERNPGVFAGVWLDGSDGELAVYNPATDEILGYVGQASVAEYEQVLASSEAAFEAWRMLPPPKRGEYVRRIGHALRQHKEALGALVSLEMGKIKAEGEGEVQEMIDICDFAVGLSRQLYGLTMASERPLHRMYEQWHPLGPVGVITAFNFPVAVWSWNSTLAAVCGDTVVWKPSSNTPLTAVAVTRIVASVMEGSGYEAVFNLVVGKGSVVGDRMINDERLPLISATGSSRVGREVARAVASRFGRSILELGGNNAVIVMDDASLELAVRAILFAAVGTAGQRCTSLRRLIVHRAIADKLIDRLVDAYKQVPIGNPLDEATLMGPLVTKQAVKDMLAALEVAREQGGTIITGGGVLDRPGNYVEPTVVRIGADAEIVQEETFAPILYVLEADDLEAAIAIQNGVRQGLSSAIFTDSLRSAERFLSAVGSDCGIANVNIGTSGAEIGGAFGGEKETGGGREAGSDSWKAYMRRQTTTINWGDDLPLAQGISFG
ncbi:MAG: L-piperidine-6-carboxylate dehydrogenase [Actinomycetota bacterium]